MRFSQGGEAQAAMAPNGSLLLNSRGPQQGMHVIKFSFFNQRNFGAHAPFESSLFPLFSLSSQAFGGNQSVMTMAKLGLFPVSSISASVARVRAVSYQWVTSSCSPTQAGLITSTTGGIYRCGHQLIQVSYSYDRLILYILYILSSHSIRVRVPASVCMCTCHAVVLHGTVLYGTVLIRHGTDTVRY
jgi:hypothetical protein